MKRVCVLVSIFAICGLAIGDSEEYSTLYDQMDVDAILKSERLTNQYVQCLLDKGPCTADGRSLRQVLPEAVATQCAKCNDRQKEIARKICTHIKEKKPDSWVLFVQKYDPEDKYMDKLEVFLSGN